MEFRGVRVVQNLDLLGARGVADARGEAVDHGRTSAQEGVAQSNIGPHEDQMNQGLAVSLYGGVAGGTRYLLVGYWSQTNVRIQSIV